jgi:hypothetical protein
MSNPIPESLELKTETGINYSGVVMTLDEFRASGLLWYINSELFHKMGYALAVRTDGDQATELILMGDGQDAWSFTDEVNEIMGPRVGAFFSQVAEENSYGTNNEDRDLSEQEG